MGRIEFLQTGFDPYPDPPQLGGIWELHDLINNYQIKDEEVWDTGCGTIIHIWPAICDGRIKDAKTDERVDYDDMEFFMDVAIENEIRYILYS
tara:strand:+ start:15 stop:293 length:279 start_codon:yes stop_codon:yes gene_type:complete